MFTYRIQVKAFCHPVGQCQEMVTRSLYINKLTYVFISLREKNTFCAHTNARTHAHHGNHSQIILLRVHGVLDLFILLLTTKSCCNICLTLAPVMPPHIPSTE